MLSKTIKCVRFYALSKRINEQCYQGKTVVFIYV